MEITNQSSSPESVEETNQSNGNEEIHVQESESQTPESGQAAESPENLDKGTEG